MAGRKKRYFVELDDDEARLLNKLYGDLKRQAKAHNKKLPTKAQVIQGCIRTAIHAVYGEEYAYSALLGPKTFRRLMGNSGSNAGEPG